MAQRLSSEERVRVDEMARAGVDVDEIQGDWHGRCSRSPPCDY